MYKIHDMPTTIPSFYFVFADEVQEIQNKDIHISQ